jgi:N-acetyl-gamma-glutamyl-phosphate reductase
MNESTNEPNSESTNPGDAEMNRVAVMGASGYAGAELVRILAGHPRVRLTALTSRQYAGKPVDALYPALTGRVDALFGEDSVETVCREADVVFLALPHKVPMAVVPRLLEAGKKVVDLSADFRFRDPAAYEAAYQPHSCPELLEEAVYGLSEPYRDRIRGARLVGNPGCYPTSVLLPLVPLVRRGLVDAGSLVADAKSGVSGAGRSPAETTHFCGVNESFKAYKVAGHRHNPEMDEILSGEAGRPVHLTFVPHLLPMTRGMETTLYAGLAEGATGADVGRCLADFYAGCPFVRLRGEGTVPDTLHVRGTNCCDIGFRVDGRARRLILLSAIDNLVKGAAGQAVQNMNLMLGIEETEGLQPVPFPL